MRWMAETQLITLILESLKRISGETPRSRMVMLPRCTFAGLPLLMKKIRGPNKLKHEAWRKARWRRRLRRRDVLSARMAGRPVRVKQVTAQPVAVPREFTFGDRREEFIEWYDRSTRFVAAWLAKVRRRRASGKRIKDAHPRRFSDFRQIKEISAPAALIVAALYDRRRQVSGVPLGTYHYDEWRPEVRQMLQGIGFFEILEMPEAKLNEDLESSENERQLFKIARYESGDRLKQERFETLITDLLRYIMAANPSCLSGEEKIEQTARLFAALVEATENTRLHAYPEDVRNDPTILPNWWLTGAANPAERKLTLVVYDQGISIPGSLASHRKSQWAGHSRINRIINRFSKGEFDQDDPVSDHAKIRLAMMHRHSATELDFRGNGMGVVREAIRYCDRGALHILSRNGEYIEQSGQKPISRQLAHPMPGTLIIWELWL